jgi:hypothetical protein
VLGAVAVHAVLGEVGQYVGDEWFATGRVGTVKDVLIDWFGMAIGCGLWSAWRKVTGQKSVQGGEAGGGEAGGTGGTGVTT